MIHPEEADNYETYIENGYTFLAKTENDDCLYVESGRCSIYETRPRVCRTYDCRDRLGWDGQRPSVRVEALKRI